MPLVSKIKHPLLYKGMKLLKFPITLVNTRNKDFHTKDGWIHQIVLFKRIKASNEVIFREIPASLSMKAMKT